MKIGHLIGLLGASALAFLFACSSSDTNTGAAGQGGSAASAAVGGTGGNGGKSSTGGSGGTTPIGDASADVVLLAGACSNDADLAAIQAKTADQMATTMKSCGTSCFTNADRKKCIADCVEKDLGVTNACAQCFGGISDCTMSNCISQCMLDSKSQGCTSCIETAGCNSTFTSCSGLPSTY
jgi:hypothetical protein